MTFTLSPVGQRPLPGPLKLSYPSSNDTDDDIENMIIHWNPGNSLNVGIIQILKDKKMIK